MANFSTMESERKISAAAMEESSSSKSDPPKKEVGPTAKLLVWKLHLGGLQKCLGCRTSPPSPHPLLSLSLPLPISPFQGVGIEVSLGVGLACGGVLLGKLLWDRAFQGTQAGDGVALGNELVLDAIARESKKVNWLLVLGGANLLVLGSVVGLAFLGKAKAEATVEEYEYEVNEAIGFVRAFLEFLKGSKKVVEVGKEAIPWVFFAWAVKMLINGRP